MAHAIAITNESTVLTDDQVKAVIPALQQQVTLHFRPYWNEDATLSFLPKGSPLATHTWQIVVLDNADQAGALGYHELSNTGTPLGKVFAKVDIDNGYSWTVTMSHELLEMLADPWINWMAQGSNGRIYALEVGDAVEADKLGYQINGVQVSDFITPSWFEPTDSRLYDFKAHLTRPFQIATEGYMSVFDPQKGWIQVAADHQPGGPQAPTGSRRDRRTLPKSEWRRSER